MEIISVANKTVLSILQGVKKTDGKSRMLHYCVEMPVEEGTLLFNLLTKEMVLVTSDEYNNLTGQEELKNRWFVVPEGLADKEYADLVKWVLTSRKKKTTAITGYTIFPTTDCNARCFYCFELGRSRVPMSVEIACKVVQYIKEHCKGEAVTLRWFGGEPLFNQEAINTICGGLEREGISFKSLAVSNGYLFDEQTVKKAVECWNLKQVQITLDGTEKIYNKTKAYIYRDGNPYRIVLDNIGYLLDAAVIVQIRLNMDLYNADDLLALVDDLSQRFKGRKGISVYAHHLFKGDEPMAKLHTDEEWKKREQAMISLEKKIQQSGLATEQGISSNIKLNFCMADSGNSITILPEGNIGLCEHHSEREFIGHIDKEEFDKAMIESWRERIPEIPECTQCFYYPQCLQLKKCSNANICFEQYRREKKRKIQKAMLSEYQRWKYKGNVENKETVDAVEMEGC